MGDTRHTSETDEAKLRELVARHGVRYEIAPETQIVHDAFTRIGFDLWLYGLHEHPEGVDPGCPECIVVYVALRDIARWSFPQHQTPTRFEIEPFDRCVRIAPDLKDRYEVRLEVKIVHRNDFFAPIDRCEEKCLGEMTQNLERLGVPQGARRPRDFQA